MNAMFALNEWVIVGIISMMALSAIVVRVRAARKPVSSAKILIPPIVMSTGLCMFFVHAMRVDLRYFILSFLAGTIFSYPLIHSTQFHVQKGNVYVRRSKGFTIVLFCLLAVRIVLHNYVSQYLSVPQTAACFFVLAYGMIVPWRVAMLLQFREMNIKTTSFQRNRPNSNR